MRLLFDLVPNRCVPPEYHLRSMQRFKRMGKVRVSGSGVGISGVRV